MIFQAFVADARVVVTRRQAMLGAVGASTVLAERLLVPVAAWTIFGASITLKLAAGCLLAVVVAVRMTLQGASTARAEATLIARAAASALSGDPIGAGLLPDRDANMALLHGVYHTAVLMAQTLPAIAGNAVAVVVLATALTFVEPPRLVLFSTGLVVFLAVSIVLSRRFADRAMSEAWRLQERVHESLGVVLDGRLEIVASGLRRDFLAEMTGRTEASGRAAVRLAVGGVVAGRLPVAAVAGLVAAALAAGVPLAGLNVATVDIVLFASVAPAFAGLAQGFYGLMRAERWVHVVALALQHEAPRERARPQPSVAPKAARRLQFEEVSFRYPESEHLALDRVSFACAAGRTVALAGANASGKTTCLRLLLALAQPLSGRIRADGTDLADMDPDQWRSRIVFLPQRPYFPQRSRVGAAVRMFAPLASEDAILAALDRVGLLTSLRRTGSDPLAVQVDTFSVGERQRLALARLLSRDASLFVLDEPDANLDREGIAFVADLLRELSRRGMVAFAAHTADLLAIADQVVTLGSGRVVRDDQRRGQDAVT